MKIMKKAAAFALAALLLLAAGACQGGASSQPGAEKITLHIAALNGPTGIGMAKLIEDGKTGQTANHYEISLMGAPDEIVSKIATGELDIAAAPTNLAATLYHKTNGNVQLLAVNTLGVLSIVTKGEEISSFADLKGKTIYATGKGSTPEYALNYLLKANGLDPEKDVTVEYLSEHGELAAKLAAGQVSIALLPEPFVTQVIAKDPSVSVALSLTKEWDKAVEGKSVLAMGCLIVRKDFAQKNPEALAAFLKEYEASAKFANENTAQCAQLVEKSGIMAQAALAEKAIPNCNITYIAGDEMKAKVKDFFQVLFDANPKSVGGTLPDDGFYYEG